MSQQAGFTSTSFTSAKTIFSPGQQWSDNTGKVFDVEEPDA